MTVLARRIASIPRRTATETWRAVCELVTQPSTVARQELEAIAGIASALITEEYTRDAPIIVAGDGPQVRLYTLHGDSAIEFDATSDTPLSHSPTSGDWTLSLPCGEDDLDDAIAAVSQSRHVEVRSLVDTSSSAAARTMPNQNLRPTIDLTALEQS